MEVYTPLNDSDHTISVRTLQLHPLRFSMLCLYQPALILQWGSILEAKMFCDVAVLKFKNLEGILGIQDFDCGVGYIPLQDEVHSWYPGPCHQLL